MRVPARGIWVGAGSSGRGGGARERRERREEDDRGGLSGGRQGQRRPYGNTKPAGGPVYAPDTRQP